MKKHIQLLIGLLVIGNLAAQETTFEVPYTEAKRYFVRNDYPDRNFHMLKIDSEERFSAIFGMAAVMGEGGQPTIIDFSKSFVIALIDDTNERTEDISINSLTRENDRLSLNYRLAYRSEPSSAQYRICKLLIVDKKYDGSVSAYSTDEHGDPMPGSDLDDQGCKPSTGYIWSFIKNECIQLWETDYILLTGSGDFGRAALLFNDDKSEAEIIGSTSGRNTVLIQQNGKNEWTSEKLILTQQPDGSFSLKEKEREIATGTIKAIEQ